MERFLSRPLAALALGIAGAVAVLPAVALTPPCGTVLTQSVTLNADMYCNMNSPALVVGADNVTIKLDGYGIYATGMFVPPFTVPGAPAIYSHGHSNVQVLGPGLIKDFRDDVDIVGGQGHGVSGITGESEGGVLLRAASDSLIQHNVLLGRVAIIENMGPPTWASGPALRNQVIDNRIGAAPQRVASVDLVGCRVGRNTVSGNKIFGQVWLDNGSYGNFLQGNRIQLDAASWYNAVLLGEAYGNLLRDNVIDADGRTGISIQPRQNPVCNAGQPGRNGDNNTIYANVIRNGDRGVDIGKRPPQGTLGTGNVILGNTMMNMTVSGMRFGPGTANNDGRKNKYSNVPVEVEDFGSGNLWP